MSRLRRAGFSLIEALVVLAVGGLALAVIFSIGTKAGDTGFKLGRGAMAAADQDLAAGDLRAIVRSIALRPPYAFSLPSDRSMEGQAQRLEVDVVMERATQCAPEGWAGRLVLEIRPQGPGQVLLCQAGDRPVTRLLEARGTAGFSYSLDGAAWLDQYVNRPDPNIPWPPPPVELWIRYSDPALTVIEMAESGRPEIWLRQNPDGL